MSGEQRCLVCGRTINDEGVRVLVTDIKLGKVLCDMCIQDYHYRLNDLITVQRKPYAGKLGHL